MFKSLGKEVLVYVCRAVSHQMVMKDQIIFEEGSIGTELFFVVEGEVSVEAQGQHLGYLGQNAFFGELPFIAVRSLTLSILDAEQLFSPRAKEVPDPCVCGVRRVCVV